LLFKMKEEPLIVGRPLVEFDRRDVPLYQERPSLWADAGADPVLYGAPLDRLFGAPEDAHVAAHALPQEVAIPLVEDPFVELGTLADTLALPDMADGLLDTAFSADAHAPAALHDAWSSDGLGTDWLFDI
jgi:hypothetical protein